MIPATEKLARIRGLLDGYHRRLFDRQDASVAASNFRRDVEHLLDIPHENETAAAPAKPDQLPEVIRYLDQQIGVMQRGADQSTAEASPQWLAARNVLRMAREFCYTLEIAPPVDKEFAITGGGGMRFAVPDDWPIHQRPTDDHIREAAQSMAMPAEILARDENPNYSSARADGGYKGPTVTKPTQLPPPPPSDDRFRQKYT